MKDPYLINGQICEVWFYDGKNKTLRYFIDYDIDETPLFTNGSNNKRAYSSYWPKYRPIGTEWDFAPNWVVCTTVDRNSLMYAWGTSDLKCDSCSWHQNIIDTIDLRVMCLGVCPDKSRYQGDAWKKSLRMRPKWVKINGRK